MLNPGSERAKKLWDEWNIRCAVLISLFFQLVLTVAAKSRKRRGSALLQALIWSCYLLADWVAAFSVGLISSGQTNDCPEKTAVSKQLAAFWAPFLLLHLGGPDSITAFSLEDNELWIRHLLGLVIQIIAVIYVLFQSLPNEYWIPSLLMFLAGACKYAERTLALYRACLGNFKASLISKPDPGPNYAQLMQEYAALEASAVPVKIDIVKEPEKEPSSTVIRGNEPAEELEYIDVVLKGYDFFDTYKGLIVDDMFSFHERNESRKFFFNRTADDAFNVMEVELNFMYDALYTKMAVVHCRIGYLSRLLCTTLMVVCFHQFASLPQDKMVRLDRVITYVLLAGAVFLDLVNLINLVFSDWAIISAKRWVSEILIRLPFGKRCSRWSNTMFQYSFISFCCLKERRFRWVPDFLKIKSTLDELQCRKKIAFREDLKKFIFEELKSKAEEAESTTIAKEIYSARGDWVLSKYPSHYPYPSISSSLSDEAEYDESLLMWHIATELCYFESSGKCDNPKRELCKVLSDYMLYLLIMRPMLMSSVAGIAQIRYQDTCAEAKKFLHRKNWEAEVACKELLDVKTVVKPIAVKGDRSKSLLFDACILANDLKKLNSERRWEMMSRIWVELLSFAASRCRPDVHARQLSQGGEVITFVWLLMVHFGLGEQFRIEAGHARAKLIIQK